MDSAREEAESSEKKKGRAAASLLRLYETPGRRKKGRRKGKGRTVTKPEKGGSFLL